MPNRKAVHGMIERALTITSGDLHELAEQVGVSYNTLWAWKAGRRNPSPDNLRKLADILDQRGGELRELAAELRRAAE